MPKKIQNFRITTAADTILQSTGPESKDGGFTTDILVRNKGRQVQALQIRGRRLTNGTLELVVEDFLRATTIFHDIYER